MYERIEEVYQLHYHDLYRFLVKLYPHPDVVDDIIHNTFLEALKSLESYQGASSMKTWLFGIAKYQLYRHLRKNKIQIDIDEIPEANFSTDTDFSDKILAQQILETINELTPPLNELMRLRLIHSLSFREIGERIGRTENYCRVNFFRLKGRLRKEYEDEEL